MAVDSAELYAGDIKSVLLSEEQIRTRTAELAEMIAEDYRGNLGNDDLLLVTVLKGAVMFVTDLARSIPMPTQLEFMAVSSYGSSTSSSGVVRILKDLDRDINDRDVLIVEDIVDSGLTLSWLLRNLATRHQIPLIAVQTSAYLRKEHPPSEIGEHRQRLRDGLRSSARAPTAATVAPARSHGS